MKILSRLFGRDRSTKKTPGIPGIKPSSGDMRTTPVNNPFDFREDGSIRPGDPAYAMMMEMMDSGKSVISNQRADGTWDVSTIDEKEDS